MSAAASRLPAELPLASMLLSPPEARLAALPAARKAETLLSCTEVAMLCAKSTAARLRRALLPLLPPPPPPPALHTAAVREQLATGTLREVAMPSSRALARGLEASSSCALKHQGSVRLSRAEGGKGLALALELRLELPLGLKVKV
jgi:hypothetical protein